MKYGIVGYGIIGKATELSLLKNQEVVIHDPKLGTRLDSLNNCEIVFICIPTNTAEDIVTIEQIINDLNPTTKIIIRCTVPVGTCKNLTEKYGNRIFYMPEFLRDRYWDTDCFSYPILVGNGAKLEALETRNPLVYADNTVLELLKMFSNNINAMKIVFANHFYDLSQTTDSDYDQILKLYKLIQNNQSYLEVTEDMRGYGGKCLPKDINFIIQTFENLGIDQQLFTAINHDNNKWPTHVRES